LSFHRLTSPFAKRSNLSHIHETHPCIEICHISVTSIVLERGTIKGSHKSTTEELEMNKKSGSRTPSSNSAEISRRSILKSAALVAGAGAA
jgi:hypothetical protein